MREFEVDATGNIMRWSNLSGTYKPDDSRCYQTGLPLDKFWAVHTPASGDADLRLSGGRVVEVHGDVLLRRVLSLSDDELEALRVQWDSCVMLICQNKEAHVCFESMHRAIRERVMAVSQYGYLVHVKKLDT